MGQHCPLSMGQWVSRAWDWGELFLSFLPLFTTCKLPQLCVFPLMPLLLPSLCHPSCLECPACILWSPDSGPLCQVYSNSLRQFLKVTGVVSCQIPDAKRQGWVPVRPCGWKPHSHRVPYHPFQRDALSAEQLGSQLLTAPGSQGSADDHLTRASGHFQYCSATLPPTLPMGDTC